MCNIELCVGEIIKGRVHFNLITSASVWQSYMTRKFHKSFKALPNMKNKVLTA